MAIEALGELGRSGADSVLLEALSSQHFPTRWTAAVALRRVGSSGSLGTLLDRIAAAPPGRASTLAMALAGPLGDQPSSMGVKRTVELLEMSSGGLRDALIDALSSVAGSAGSAPLVRLVPLCASATRAKVAEVLATHPEARQTLIGLAHDTDASVRANAVWSLGHVADPSDRELLVAGLDDPDVAVASNSVGALALLALSRKLDIQEVLCTALGDARSYVVANALSGLTLLGERCTPRVDPSWLLHHHHSDEVRLAAARLLKRRPEWRTPGDSRPLMRCAARDLSGRVAAECSSQAVDKPTTPAPATPWVSVLVHRLGETEPEPRAAFSLVRADGLIRSGMADRLGGVSESNVPAGDIRLTLPAPFSD
jgi:HEAT repeat protein